MLQETTATALSPPLVQDFSSTSVFRMIDSSMVSSLLIC